MDAEVDQIVKLTMTLSTVIGLLVHIALLPILFAASITSNMLKRLSSQFRKPKKDEARQQVNGVDHGDHGHDKDADKPTVFVGGPVEEHHASIKEEVESSLAKFAQLIHAARRPLPTQTGDGAYLDHPVPTSLMKDLTSLGFKDVNTLMQVMKTKATGALQDDKTYLMERVIQVSSQPPPDTDWG